MATLVIEQPNYLPWLGYFDLLDQADLWVWLDDVQYTRRDWRSRNCVAALDGAARWLTVPVLSRGKRDQTIAEAQIDYSQDWPRKHLDTIRHCYGKAPFFGEVFPVIESQLARRPAALAELTIPLCEALARLLGVEARFVRSSALTGVLGRKQERLLEIHAQVGGEVYLSGPAAEGYIEPAEMARAGLELRYIRYDYQPFQLQGAPRTLQLSVVDPLMWLGPDATREHWRKFAGWRQP